MEQVSTVDTQRTSHTRDVALAQRRRRRRTFVGLGLGAWLCGLYFMLLGEGLVKVHPDNTERYLQKADQVDRLFAEIQPIKEQYILEDAQLRAHKTWFWWLNADKKAQVRKHKTRVNKVRAELDALLAHQRRLMSDAKAQLGVWSDAGVKESQQLFWDSFQDGKVFAQRQTFWDALFQILGRRDEGLLVQVIQLILTLLINFTTGMIAAVFVFLVRLPWMIWSFQPNVASGAGFFVVSGLGALSVVASYLGLLYGTSAAVVYGISVPLERRIASERRRAAQVRYHAD